MSNLGFWRHSRRRLICIPLRARTAIVGSLRATAPVVPGWLVFHLAIGLPTQGVLVPWTQRLHISHKNIDLNCVLPIVLLRCVMVPHLMWYYSRCFPYAPKFVLGTHIQSLHICITSPYRISFPNPLVYVCLSQLATSWCEQKKLNNTNTYLCVWPTKYT